MIKSKRKTARPPAWKLRRRRTIAEELKHAAGWHYLSFAFPYTFLGAAIVRAHGVATATQRARELGIMPHLPCAAGEVPMVTVGTQFQCMTLTKDDMRRIPLDLRNRLLSAEEVQTRLAEHELRVRPAPANTARNRCHLCHLVHTVDLPCIHDHGSAAEDVRDILGAAVEATLEAINRVGRTASIGDDGDYIDGTHLPRLQHAYRMDRLQGVVKELEEMRNHFQAVIDLRGEHRDRNRRRRRRSRAEDEGTPEFDAAAAIEAGLKWEDEFGPPLAGPRRKD